VFEPGRALMLVKAGGQQPAEIESFRRQHGRTVIKLRGIDSISDAERIIGADIRMRRKDLPAPEEGSFYTFQLKGCEVYAAGERLGRITGILDAGATPILQVETGSEELLIPFAQSYLKKIDVGERRIDVELPEGLRGLNRS
jgi:16S rRNA processing protein RimM